MVTYHYFVPDRYLEENLQITIIYGEKKPKNIFEYLTPTMRDLLTLQKEGMSVKTTDGQEFKFEAFVIAIIRDFPAMAELALHKLHASLFDCRICTVKGQKTEIDVDMFLLGITKKPKETNDIKGTIPFSLFLCFNGSSSFGLDALHLWGHNVARQLWEIIKYRDEIGKIMDESKSKTPTDAFDDIAQKPGYARGVDWILFLEKVFPTILIEMYEKQEHECKKDRRGRALLDEIALAMRSI